MRPILKRNTPQLLSCRVPGCLIQEHLAPFRQTLDAALKEEPYSHAVWQTLEIDLSKAQHVDSRGLDQLVKLTHAVKARQRKLRIVVARPHIARSLPRMLKFLNLQAHAEVVMAAKDQLAA